MILSPTAPELRLINWGHYSDFKMENVNRSNEHLKKVNSYKSIIIRIVKGPKIVTT